MKSSLNVVFGIGAGVINCIAWYLFSRSLPDYEVAMVDNYRFIVTLVLLLIGIFLSVFLTRKQRDGFLEFKQAFNTGALYTIILALILAVFNYLYYKFIMPDAVAVFISEAKKQLPPGAVKPEEMPAFEERLQKYLSVSKMFGTTLIYGILFSLLIGAIFQKKPPTVPFSEN